MAQKVACINGVALWVATPPELAGPCVPLPVELTYGCPTVGVVAPVVRQQASRLPASRAGLNSERTVASF